jgi:alkanesulfonate monooxygenase SsuD/methylene tetrahydromethanopterin reductase-like flavin-dependent oxidoreductase (luciferase family)
VAEDSEQPTIPLQIFASGPRTAAIAGRLGDRVTITVGARPELVAARLDTVRQARTTAGLDPTSIDLGVYLIATVDDDLTRARSLVCGDVAIFPRFQRHVTDLGRADQAVVAAVTERWQEASHGLAVSARRILAAARQASRALVERREAGPGSTGAGRSPR